METQKLEDLPLLFFHFIWTFPTHKSLRVSIRLKESFNLVIPHEQSLHSFSFPLSLPSNYSSSDSKYHIIYDGGRDEKKWREAKMDEDWSRAYLPSLPLQMKHVTTLVMSLVSFYHHIESFLHCDTFSPSGHPFLPFFYFPSKINHDCCILPPSAHNSNRLVSLSLSPSLIFSFPLRSLLFYS